jgi:competence protein ComEC
MTISQKTMLGFILVFLCSSLWPSLPQISLIAFACVVLIFSVLSRTSPVVNGVLVGFIWASVCGYYYLNWQIDASLYNKNLVVEGVVVSLQPPPGLNSDKHAVLSSETLASNATLPRYKRKRAVKFNFVIQKIGPNTQVLKPTVRLTWYDANLPMQQGDKLKLVIRLKPAVGLGNPDGFNYQKWLTSKNIVALGYVKASPTNRFVKHHASLRQRLVNNLLQHDLVHIKWILALSYGDRRLLETDDWALMQRTGTAHLFAISGMHLGIVFVFTLLLSKASFYLYSIVVKTPLIANTKAKLLMIPCVVAIFYALIAGYEVPVMRALITLLVWTAITVLSKYWRLPSVLFAILTSFFILFPFSMLGISFWFSFVAVLIITFFVWRVKISPNASRIQKLAYGLKLQLFISVMTLPMIAMTFSSLPFMAFFANLFMIPIVTFVLVPLCLLAAIGSLLQIDCYPLYVLINNCFEISFLCLNGFDAFSADLFGDNWKDHEQVKNAIDWMSKPAIMFVLLLCALPPWYRKNSVILSVVIMSIGYDFVEKMQLKTEKASQIYVFDVGQGSALVINDAKGTMLYDTGGSFAGFSMAASVLLPFFDANNIQTLDYFILSHLDNDHAGGAKFIAKNLQLKNVLSPNKGCNRADHLKQHPNGKARYLSYDVDIIWPLVAVSGNENDDSCVIKLQKGRHSILLTGDIEKESEEQLLSLYRDTNVLKSNILIAPHHGSKTSSTQQFVKAVSPEYVVFSSGANNRWGFPAQEVVKRYERVNAKIFVTGQQGRIRFQLTEDDISVSTFRGDEYKRWYFKIR